MKKIILFLLLLLSTFILYAQTWTGTSNANWNEAANWNPAGVPAVTANIVIPGSVASNNWPVFSGDVTVNSIDMQPGCRLDVNGFTLTVTGVNMNNNFNGAVFDNSNSVATDIIININTGINGFITYFRSNTVNDNIIFNITGSNQFIEAGAAPANTYNGHVEFNINDMLSASISYGVPSVFNGNLSVNRTIAGVTSLFYAGAIISGNFSFTDNSGSSTYMGNPGIKTSIGGSVNILVNNPSPAVFEMHRLVNQTTGGNINILNSKGFNLQLDTLLVNSMNITGYRGNEFGKLLNNHITGNIIITDDVSYTGGFVTYVRNNVLIGNCNFTVTGANTFFESDVAGTGNTYFGNVSFNSTGAAMYIGSGASLQCSGNLSINRTGAGFTSAFYAGATIGGDFWYNNQTAGNTYLGSLNNKTSVAGKLYISALYTIPNVFEMLNLENKTNGGFVSLQNTLGFNFQKDTLLLSDFIITGYGGNEYGRLLNNDISANVTVVADASYSNGFATYIRNNKFTGNCQFTSNGTNPFYEADIASSANKYYGNLDMVAAGAADIYIAFQDTLWCSGNFSISRSTAGNIIAFNAGATIIGNFTYSNNTAGDVYFGNLNSRTSVGGTLDIDANYALPGIFRLHRMINHTSGGNIYVQNSLGFDLQNDTLNIVTLNISGYQGNEYGRLMKNELFANVTISPDAGYSSGFATYIRNNNITGNTQFTSNGTNAFMEADMPGTGNIYQGNLSVTAAGSGDLFIGFMDSLWCSGNFSINRLVAGNTTAFYTGGTITGNFTYINNTSGNTSLGNINHRTGIMGSINIQASYVTPNVFILHRFINMLNGGNITVENSLGFDLLNDTLLVGTVSITGYTGNAYGRLLNNSITGNITLADDAAYPAGYFTYIRNNVITGNCQFSINSNNAILDADFAGSGNKYVGNLTYIRNGGSIVAASNEPNELSGNLILQSVSDIYLGKWIFSGNTNGMVEQLSSQPVSIAEFTIQKDAGSSVTLNDAVTISSAVIFSSGIINSSAGNELIFADNSIHWGSSANSYVNGPVVKTGNDPFTFPVGNLSTYAPLSISAPDLPTDEFKATYFRAIPHNSGYDSTLIDPTINHISDNEFWLLDRTGGMSAVTVTLSWETSRSGIIDNMPDLRVARWNGSLWKDEGNGGTTGSNAAGSVVTAAAVNTFSPFTLASSSVLNPIPVKLVSFSAAKNNGTVLLQWITENDVTISRYEIERGTDPAVFNSLTGVVSKGSVSQIIYRADDNYPFAGINYYRLKIIGIDGSVSYSNIVKIDTDKKYNISIWPNPAHGHFTISGADEFIQIQIIDVTGKLVMHMNKAADNHYNIKNLNKGIYYARLSNSKESVTIKLVIE